MIKITKQLFFFAIIAIATFSITTASAQPTYNPFHPPAFKDHGKAIEKLKATYSCENIEFENWEADDATDDQITVCIMNSTKVPSGDINATNDQFKAIARQIKNAIKHPEKYKSYYIIFVKTETMDSMVMKSHTAGMVVSATGL